MAIVMMKPIINNVTMIKEIVVDLKEAVKKNGMGEHEAVSMIWVAVMTAVDFNKREDLLQDQVNVKI